MTRLDTRVKYAARFPPFRLSLRRVVSHPSLYSIHAATTFPLPENIHGKNRRNEQCDLSASSSFAPTSCSDAKYEISAIRLYTEKVL